MSYTTVDHVRHHLTLPAVPQTHVTDQMLTLSGIDPISFFPGPVLSSSVCVKTFNDSALVRSLVSLSSGVTVLGAAGTALVRGSVVVAADSSLGQLFVENRDYTVDYEHATLQIKSGGDLIAGQSVVVWTLPFTLYSPGIDYQLNPDRGELRRLAGGDIASGETLFLDYSPLYTSVNDEIVNYAVSQANALIEREVDPTLTFGADPTLGSAATCRALEIICHAAAARDLGALPNGDKTAPIWIKLADRYSAQAERLLRNFHPPVTPPARPRLT